MRTISGSLSPAKRSAQRTLLEPIRGVAGKTLHEISGHDYSMRCAPPAVAAAGLRDMGDGGAMSGVTGVIMAGAQPWGACALEKVIPLALAPIANEPLLTHLLVWLAESGVRSANICGNSYTQVVRRLFTNGLAGSYAPAGMKIDYYEDLAPRGPAGCVRDAGLGSACETLVVVDGSLIPQVDLRELVGEHVRSGAALTVVVSGDANASGVNGDRLTPMGIYVFSRGVLEHISPNGYQDIKEALIPHLYRLGIPVVPYLAACPAPRVTNVDSYLGVNAWLLKTISGRSRELKRYRNQGYRTMGEGLVHVSASVDSTARLIGPILIGKGTSVERGVTIVGPTSIGPYCKVGEGAVICRTSVWDACTVEPGARLDRCILTSRASVRGESAYRYVVFSEVRKRFGRLGNGNHHKPELAPIGEEMS